MRIQIAKTTGSRSRPKLTTTRDHRSLCLNLRLKIMVYSDIEPYETGFLKVSGIHTLYYEVSGNKEGNPVIFLHGGPGGGTSPKDRIFFNPKKYKIILLDQRGAGKSTPSASLEENTTWDLVEDIERLRKHLKVDRWVVFGGSWGSTLSLAYAQAHPDPVKALILRSGHTFNKYLWLMLGYRGIFTLRKSEEGTSHLFPEEWDDYLAPIPEGERGDLVKAYHKLLNSADEQTRLSAARAWSKWEMATSKLKADPDDIARATKDDWANAFARIENHYFINEGFMRQGQLLERQSIDKIRHIPCVVVQGRYDVVCPARSAYDLKKAWPELKLQITHAGHSVREEETTQKLVEATDHFSEL
ncbi:prolyl aminopeptidase serine peptidase [Cantharellus anzutake]|uniref:prolyl aminopeptidase serine peptidase n=1 Tax=Cantharellus anzutake TaxID=1750568 RepID=UPI001907C9BC|nr:prolyl aminopeptidase serine peptidase [Cantharellus anzutake]KAF8339830.1 prolyl aminopeptidase serine peptidase [Cantharellus anzutake]